jgi:hypothetical protein
MTTTYQRITGSQMQGDGSAIAELAGTLVVNADGTVHIHDGTTAGGHPLAGSAFQLTSSTSVATLTSDNALTLPGTITLPGAINWSGGSQVYEDSSIVINSPSADVVLTAGSVSVSLLPTGTLQVPGVLQGTGGDPNVYIEVANGSGGYHTWTFSNTGTLTLPGEIKNGTAGLAFPSGGVYLTTNLNDDNNALYIDPTSHNAQLYVGGKITLSTAVMPGTSELDWTFGVDGTLSVPGSLNYNVPGLGGDGHFDINSWYPVKITTGDGVDNAVATWTFGVYQGGNAGLTFPDSTVQTTAWTGVVSTLTNGSHTATLDSSGVLTTPSDIVINNGSTLRLQAASYGASLVANGTTYSFGSGGITFPDSTVQTTAWTGTVAYSNITGAPAAFSTSTLVSQAVSATTAVSLNNNGVLLRAVQAPSLLTGAPGDQAGDVAFDSNYLYYSTTAYGGVSYNTFIGLGTFGSTVYIAKSGYTYSSITANEPQPQVGWTITIGGTQYTITSVSDAGVQNNYGLWQVFWTGATINPGTGTPVTVTNPGSGNIWVRSPWGALTTASVNTLIASSLTNYTTTATVTSLIANSLTNLTNLTNVTASRMVLGNGNITQVTGTGTSTVTVSLTVNSSTYFYSSYTGAVVHARLPATNTLQLGAEYVLDSASSTLYVENSTGSLIYNTYGTVSTVRAICINTATDTAASWKYSVGYALFTGNGTSLLTNNGPSISTPTISGGVTFLNSQMTLSGTLSANSPGFLGMPQTTTTATYTLALTDQGKHVYATSATTAITIPANTVTSFPVGSTVAIIAGPGSTATIAINSDTLYLGGSGSTGTRTLAPFGMATAVKVAATTWFISGSGLT